MLIEVLLGLGANPVARQPDGESALSCSLKFRAGMTGEATALGASLAAVLWARKLLTNAELVELLATLGYNSVKPQSQRPRVENVNFTERRKEISIFETLVRRRLSKSQVFSEMRLGHDLAQFSPPTIRNHKVFNDRYVKALAI